MPTSPLEQLAGDTTDFDINKWEAGETGKFYDIDEIANKMSPIESVAAGKDFDIFEYENRNKPSPTSVEGRPQIQPPAVQMMASNVAQALNPTESVAGPGEASYVAQADPQSQSKMLAAAVVGAGGATAMMTGSEGIAALKAAAKTHPIVAKVIVKGLEGMGLGAGIKAFKLLE
jgi:hypothetical protein